jgi:hypothetical protein
MFRFLTPLDEWLYRPVVEAMLEALRNLFGG